jgi:hypothetical protein
MCKKRTRIKYADPAMCPTSTFLNLPNGIVQFSPGRECSLTGWKEKETQYTAREEPREVCIVINVKNVFSLLFLGGIFFYLVHVHIYTCTYIQCTYGKYM